MKKRLGVNIDHVATVRNARGSKHPDPLLIAKQVMSYKADSITIHLREDRRHINDLDVIKICKNKNILTNLEISLNDKILNTTEGGLNLSKYKSKITSIILKFKKKNIRTSLFIDPNLKDVKIAKKLGVNCVELHTGKISNLVKNKKNFKDELNKIKKCCILARKTGIEVHAGHGLDYKTTEILSKIPEIVEFNIGHFIIGEAITYGLSKTIKSFKKILNK